MTTQMEATAKEDVVKRKKLLLGAGVLSVLGFAALLLTLTASAAKTKSAKASKQGECYPANSFEINPGETHARLKNVYIQSAKFAIEPKFGGTETAAMGWVRVNSMSFDVFDGGPFQGKASVDFKINGNGNGGIRHFESRCIQEAGTDADDTEDIGGNDVPVTDQFEAEFEGTVSGFPFAPGNQPAVATISGMKLPGGGILLHFNVEQGSTCFETAGEIGSSNEDFRGKTSGSLSADDTDSARWDFPDGFDDSGNCPGAFA